MDRFDNFFQIQLQETLHVLSGCLGGPSRWGTFFVLVQEPLNEGFRLFPGEYGAYLKEGFKLSEKTEEAPLTQEIKDQRRADG